MGDLDIVHVIRQAGILVPGTRIHGSHHAERIVKVVRSDEQATGLQAVASLLRSCRPDPV
ncbi:hypothetical protein ACIXHL_22070 [Bacteroides fragilis]